MVCEAQLTDAMVNLLIETVHKIGSRSKRKVVGTSRKTFSGSPPGSA